MSRHFVRIGDRWVHYRRFGEGPAVLVLHGSPQSSRAVVALCEGLAGRGLCAIAPDTPGNGLSTPLPGEPSAAHYAEALKQFAAALGLGRVALYGFHTGAAIACVFAARYPEHTASAVLNGLSAWTDAERDEMLAHYLPVFRPTWDGAHMAWAWGRVEEHTVFFPWHRATPETRMIYDVPSVVATHKNALDLLEAGDGYRAPYAAAFRFRTEAWLPKLACPALIAASRLDPLRPHLERPVFAGTPVQVFPDAATLTQAATAHLLAYPGDPAPPAPASGSDADGIARGWVEGLFWTGRPSGTGRPLVLLHGAGDSGRAFGKLIAGPVVALDLPGHGLSAGEALTEIEPYTDRIAATIIARGLDLPAVAGIGIGAMIANRLVARGIASAAGALGRPTPPNDLPVSELAPSLAPEWDGGHLLRAFRIARWERLFEPWCRRDRAHARPQGDLDPASIQGRALDLLLAGPSWAAALTAERAARDQTPSSLSIDDDPAAWAGPLTAFAQA
jgi:pimeloyl-ACP methyl ester carboxylesterase